MLELCAGEKAFTTENTEHTEEDLSGPALYRGESKIVERQFTMSSPRSITKWNILALLVMISGVITTLGLDQIVVRAWAGSGQAFPIGQKSTIALPAGDSMVWYEGLDRVPVSDVSLFMYDPDGDRVKPEILSADIDWALLLGRKCGRALWRLHLPRAGVYEFSAFNHNFASDREIPPDDRIVFLKTPDSLAEITLLRRIIQITGANVTVTSAVVLYLLHFLALRKRRSAGVRAAEAVA
jgi:hypothetical protein